LKILVTVLAAGAIVVIALYALVLLWFRIVGWWLWRQRPAPPLGGGLNSLDVKAWLAAGARLMEDPAAEVTCPNCGGGQLVIHDSQPLPGDPPRFERLIMCTRCTVTERFLFYPASTKNNERRDS
jgi:hypothetical protein